MRKGNSLKYRVPRDDDALSERPLLITCILARQLEIYSVIHLQSYFIIIIIRIMINYVVELLITILAVFLSWCVMTYRLCLSTCLIRSPFLSNSPPLIHILSTHPFRFSPSRHSTLSRSAHTTNAYSSPSRALIYEVLFATHVACARRCPFRDCPQGAIRGRKVYLSFFLSLLRPR